MKELNQNNYNSFIKEVIATINLARYDAFKSINKHHIGLNYEIGKQIVANQEKFAWGKSIVNSMSQDINKKIDGVKGYSPPPFGVVYENEAVWLSLSVARLSHFFLIKSSDLYC